MSRQIIAIDIRTDLIAGVLLNTGLKSNSVVACSHIPFNGDSSSPDHFNNALSQIVEDISSENATLVVAMPANTTIYRTLTIPFKEDSKIRQVLPFELEPSLPMPVDDLVIGFQKETMVDQSEVMATAVERRRLNHYLDVFTECHLAPQLVVPGSFPAVLELIANASEMPEHALVIDADDNNSTLYALAAGRICLVRNLQTRFDTDENVEHLALKIRQTLTAFGDAQNIDFAPSDVFLHGPAFSDFAAVERLNSALALPTQPLDLHQRKNNVEISTSIGYDPWIYDNALALACLEAESKPCPNFLRTGSAIRNYWTAYRPYIRTPAILFAIVMVLGLGGVLFENHLLQNQLDDINGQMKQILEEAFPGIGPSQDPLGRMKSKLKEAQNDVAAPLASNRIRSMDALLEISKLLPTSITVVMNRMVVGDDAITLSGVTSGFNSVDDIKGRIESSAIFKKVTIASANMDKSGKNVRFKLKLDL